MPHLDPLLHQRITRFCEMGDDFAANGQYLQAIDAYRAARQLLPEPQAQWQAATWIAAAIADAHFLAGHFKAAHDVLREALTAGFPGAADNAFIRLRLGQAAFELGDETLAREALQHARQYGSDAVFDGEDAKYLAWLDDAAKV